MQSGFFCLTGELSGRWHISQGETEIPEILVAAVVHGGEVLPLLNGPGEIHGIQRDLQLAFKQEKNGSPIRLKVGKCQKKSFLTLLIGGGESVVIVNGENEGLVESLPGNE